MHIGIFSDTYFPQLNGVATSIQTLSRALEQRGHQVYLFTPSDPRQKEADDPHVFRLRSIPFFLVKNYRATVAYPPHVVNMIDKLNLDVIHTQTEFSVGVLGKFVSSRRGIPMVHTYHTMYEDYVHYIAGGHLVTPEMAGKFSKIFCNTASHVIAPTAKTEHLLKHYGVSKPIHVIPTGIDTTNFEKSRYSDEEILSLRESLGLKADTPVIISIGRIAKEKSIDVIIRALPALIRKLPEVRFVIVGEGMEAENLLQLAQSLGVTEHLLFTGGKPWSEIGKYYRLGNVFCSASVSETQGLTFAEAMAAGIPVVAKKDECIENIVSDGQTGLLFEKEEDLPQLLYRVLTDRACSEMLSQNGIDAMQKLSVEAFADHVEALYQQVIAETAAQGPKQHRHLSLPFRSPIQTVRHAISVPYHILGSGISKHVLSHGEDQTPKNGTK